MGTLLYKGEPIEVPDHRIGEMLKVKGYSVPAGQDVQIQDAALGRQVSVSGEDVAIHEGLYGSHAQTQGEWAEGQEDLRLEREHGGIIEGAITGIEAGLGSATFGATDLALGAIGGEEYRKNRSERRQVHSGIAMAGDVAGMLVPGTGLVKGGSLLAKGARMTPAAQAARIGAKGGLKRLAAEGAVFGAGQAAHELALSNDPLSMEQAAGTILKGALFGGAIGGGVGVFAKAAGKGLSKAKHIADDAASKLGKKSGIADDLLGLSRVELRAAQKAEAATIGATSAAAKAALVDDIAALHRASKAAGSEISLGSALGNTKSLARNPKKILDTLERSEQALAKISAQGTKARAVGDIAEQAKFAQVDDLLQQNRSMQSRIHEAYAPVPTPRMQQIEDALEMSSTGAAPKSLVEKAAEGAIFGAVTSAVAPVAGSLSPLIGGKAASKITDLVFGRLARSSGEAAARTAKSVSSLMDVTAKVGKAAKPLATRTLVAASFGPLSKDDPAPKKHTLQSAYKARSAEILSQVTMGPQGITMRPGARRKLSERLSGVRAASPRLADHIETVANRKISFLANKLPKRPDFLRHTTGPDRWQPSNAEMRKFAGYVAALDDPGAVEERLADGSLSPQDAEAYRAVFPEKYADLQRTIAEQLPELQAALPYAKRVSLSIFSGVAVDPSLDPRIFARIQSQYTEEPGTEAGTSAPKPMPQFGSIKSPEKAETPSQERQS